jgi:multiple sugar transport system substrate-binding protein
MSDSRPISLGKLNRRQVLKTGGAASSAFAMPYFFSRRASAQAQTLTFWQFYSPGGTVATQDQWFADMVASWNGQNETQVELQFIPVADYLGGAVLPTAFASGEGPDIFIISPGDFLRYANGGVLTDLTPYMEQAAIDDFYPGVIASRMVDGKVYALPMEVEPMAMYYSVEAFESAGLTEADVPQTWEQLLAVAEQLTTDERFGVLFETGPGYYQNFTWYPFMWQGGGDFVGEDGKTSLMREQGTIDALKLWQDAVNMGVAPRDMLGNGGGDIGGNLVAGYCAMQNVGIWALSDLKVNYPDYQFGVFKLPLPPGGTYTTDLGGWAFCANAEGQNPEVAAQFCVWALGSMEADSIQRVTDWCTKAKADMPPRASVLENPDAVAAYAEGGLKVFAEEILPGGRAEPRLPPEVYQAVSDAIQAAQLGGEDPEAAANTAAETIETFLATYEGVAIL